MLAVRLDIQKFLIRQTIHYSSCRLPLKASKSKQLFLYSLQLVITKVSNWWSCLKLHLAS